MIAQSDPSAVLAAYYAGTTLPPGASVTPDTPDPLFPAAQARPLVVKSPYVNANSLFTDGIDVDIRAHFGLPHGVRLKTELNLTDIFRYDFTASGTTSSYVGTQAPYILSSGAGTPKYRANWSSTLDYGPASLSATVTYSSGYLQTGVDLTGTASPVTGCLYSGADGNPFPAGCKIKSFVTVDMNASYKINAKFEIYANVLNLLDALPPINPANYAGGGANYNPTYTQSGIVGRFFRVGVHAKF